MQWFRSHIWMIPYGILDGLLGPQRGKKSGGNTTEMMGRYYGIEVLQCSHVWGLSDLRSFSGSGQSSSRPRADPLIPSLLCSQFFPFWKSHRFQFWDVGLSRCSGAFPFLSWGKEESESSDPPLWVQQSLFQASAESPGEAPCEGVFVCAQQSHV